MVGIELIEKVEPFIIQLVGRVVLTLPASATEFSLQPPLTIGHDELAFVAEKNFSCFNLMTNQIIWLVGK